MWFIMEDKFQGVQITIAMTWVIWFINAFIFMKNFPSDDSPLSRKYSKLTLLFILACISVIGIFVCTLFSTVHGESILDSYKFTYFTLETKLIPTEVIDNKTLKTKINDIAYIVARYYMTNNVDFICYAVQGEKSSFTDKALFDLNQHLALSGDKRSLKENECNFFGQIDVRNTFGAINALSFFFILNSLSLLVCSSIVIYETYFNVEETSQIIFNDNIPSRKITNDSSSDSGLFDSDDGFTFTSGYVSHFANNFTIVDSDDDLELADIKYSLSKVSVDKGKENNEYFRDVYINSINICPITTQPIENAAMTYCGHMFERVSLEDWILGRTEKGLDVTCPTCSQIMKKF